jgi:hypothetical protein
LQYCSRAHDGCNQKAQARYGGSRVHENNFFESYVPLVRLGSGQSPDWAPAGRRRTVCLFTVNKIKYEN